MQATPILKWAGGKSQLKSIIESRIPSKFQNKPFNYVEPFIGGGAIFFWLKSNYNIKNAIVNDINPNLINCYQVVQKDVESLIDCLNSLQDKYRTLLSDADKKKEFYYSMREAFNSNSGNSIEKAAQLIFLNRTCFNGLYRVNRSGKFNVPIGSYKNPKICDADNLRLAAKAFEDTVITNRDYADALQFANPETLFYLDPPYKPLNATSSFNSYSKGSFDDKEQIRLSEFCHDLTKKKCCWILSNSDVNTEENPDKFFDELYEGFDIRRVKASRLINSISSKRGQLNELLISSS